MTLLRIATVALAAGVLGGCSVQKIADGGPALTRTIKVPADEVVTYNSASDIVGRYEIVEDVWLKDDGSSSPEILERNLREVAGARGANGLILAATNRKANGVRIDTKVRLDNPFDYFAGTAVWVGDTPRRVKLIRP